MSLPRSLHAVVALLAAGTPVLQLDAQGAPERFALDGEAVRVYNLAGSVRVERGSGQDVVVEVTRRGPDASRLAVQVGALDGRQTVRVIFPDDRVVFRREGAWRGWNSRTRVRVDEHGRFGSGVGGRSVEIAGSGSGLEASADVRVLVPAGRRVSIHLAAGEASATGVQADVDIDVAMATVDVRDVRGALSLDTGSGEVRVADVQGDVVVDAGSGGVHLERVRGGRVMLDLGSGGVTASDVTATHLDVDSGSGAVRLRGIRAPDLRLDSGSGRVELQLLSDVERIEMDTGSGGVLVSLPEELGAELVVEVGSGGIDVDIPLDGMRRSRNRLTSTLGDGRGQILIDSGSGGVRLRRS